jgi:hypothetical protein
LGKKQPSAKTPGEAYFFNSGQSINKSNSFSAPGAIKEGKLCAFVERLKDIYRRKPAWG